MGLGLGLGGGHLGVGKGKGKGRGEGAGRGRGRVKEREREREGLAYTNNSIAEYDSSLSCVHTESVDVLCDDGNDVFNPAQSYFFSSTGTLLAGGFQITAQGISGGSVGVSAGERGNTSKKPSLHVIPSSPLSSHSEETFLSPVSNRLSMRVESDEYGAEIQLIQSDQGEREGEGEGVGEGTERGTDIHIHTETETETAVVTEEKENDVRQSNTPFMLSSSDAASSLPSSSSCLSPSSPSSSSSTIYLSKNDLVSLSVIGRGQNGVVLKAIHLPTLTLCALKTMSVYDRGTRHQLLHELSVYTKLTSPFLVAFLGAYHDGGNTHTQ